MDANPDPENRMLERYELAESMLSWNLTNKVFRNNIQLYQIDETRFWYRVNEREQNRYYLVDTERGVKTSAFDEERLAAAMESAAPDAGIPAPSLNLLPRLTISRSEEHTSELQSRGHLVCRLLLDTEKVQH